ncbi:MAG: GGDEF domain-containing protein [Spirochaetales bacterium]|nr:GGDEF domain-containing protein [Spirochaetales bacterium]
MNDETWRDNEGEENPEIIAHYDLLERVGIIDRIDRLTAEIRNLEELYKEGLDIFSKTSIPELVEYVTARLLNKFVPSYLAFVLHDEERSLVPRIFCYRNMKLVENLLTIDSLEPYESFFLRYPNTISFSLLEYKLENPGITEKLLPLFPEIIVPIIGIGGFYGFIVFGRKLLEREYTRQEIAYLDRLMRFTSVSIQNNIHYRSAITDYKTRLYNHSFFTRRFDEESSRIKRHHSEASLLMLDIDHFKRFNDTYGHQAGDDALFKVARVMESCVRKEDVTARFGGEEFIILLVQSRLDIAWTVAERIRTTVENSRFVDGKATLTVSIGVVHISDLDDRPFNALVEMADEALYRSKRGGRNRTTFHNPGLFEKALEASRFTGPAVSSPGS